MGQTPTSTRLKRMAMILPVPIPAIVLDSFAAQIPQTLRRPDIAVDFSGCRAGATLLDSAYEATLADAFVLDEGVAAARRGSDIICSFSMSDSGVAALRSRLSIPVVGACHASFLLAAQLGRRFSVITMWDPWARMIADLAVKYGFGPMTASVRHIGVRPDTHELLSGKEDFVFDRIADEARLAMDRDGADVIVLGSTTMYQSYAFLSDALDCPVVNPGLAAYKQCETILDLGLTHSKRAFPAPDHANDDLMTPIAPLF